MKKAYPILMNSSDTIKLMGSIVFRSKKYLAITKKNYSQHELSYSRASDILVEASQVNTFPKAVVRQHNSYKIKRHQI